MVVFRSLLCGLATEPHPFGLSGSKPCADRGAYVGKGREPGVARRRVTFFRFAERKSPKKGRPPVCDPFAVRRGKPASGRLRGAPQNSLRACGAPFEQLRRVSSRSMGAATPMPPRNRPAAGAASRGGTAEQPNSQHGPSLRSASRSRREAPARCGPSAAQRSNGPCGCPHPGFPSGCAEERSGQRIRARDCLSEASLSETPLDASTAGCPKRSAGTQRVGSPFLW